MCCDSQSDDPLSLVLDWCHEATFANVAQVSRHYESELASGGERWKEGGEGPTRDEDSLSFTLPDNDEGRVRGPSQNYQ